MARKISTWAARPSLLLEQLHAQGSALPYRFKASGRLGGWSNVIWHMFRWLVKWAHDGQGAWHGHIQVIMTMPWMWMASLILWDLQTAQASQSLLHTSCNMVCHIAVYHWISLWNAAHACKLALSASCMSTCSMLLSIPTLGTVQSTDTSKRLGGAHLLPMFRNKSVSNAIEECTRRLIVL